MATWTRDELATIDAEDELDLAARLADGALCKPVTIWAVRVGEDVYIRAVRGRAGAWFRAAQACHEGHITVGGVRKDVTFVEVDASDDVNNAIDGAYRAKYRRYAASIVNSTLTPQARAATLEVVPQ